MTMIPHQSRHPHPLQHRNNSTIWGKLNSNVHGLSFPDLDYTKLYGLAPLNIEPESGYKFTEEEYGSAITIVISIIIDSGDWDWEEFDD